MSPCMTRCDICMREPRYCRLLGGRWECSTCMQKRYGAGNYAPSSTAFPEKGRRK